jgi:Zn-dependent peptidase ImmA (M78 family)
MNTNQAVNHDEIENNALDVLDAYNITKPVVDVAKIAKGEEIEIKEITMPQGYVDVAGFHDKDKKVIYVNIDDSGPRKLFTVAHELGHIFLEHKNYNVLFRIPKKDSKYGTEEMGANSFAAHLLMPDFMLREYMKKYNLSKLDYKVMADIFGVPLSAMKPTLERLK